MSAAVLAVVLLAGVALFQIAAAAGAPVGPYCWGGRHAGRLPIRLRIASAASIPVSAVLAFVILAGAGAFGAVAENAAAWAIWLAAAFFAVGVVANFMSRSPRERWVMGPVVLALTVLTVIAALS